MNRLLQFRRFVIAPALLLAAWMVLGGLAAAQSSPPRLLSLVTAIGGPEKHPLRWPVAIAAGADGDYAIADAFESRLLVYRSAGIAWQFDQSVALPAAPLGVTHDGRRFILSLRQTLHLLTLEEPDLTQQKLLLPDGTVPGAIAYADRRGIVVFNLATERILVLSRNGEVETKIPVGGRVSALAVSNQGDIFASLPARGEVVAFGSDGQEKVRWQIPGVRQKPAWPVGITNDPGGDLLVLDRHGDRVLILDPSGRAIGTGARNGWETGLLRLPSAITRLSTGEIVVADQGNSRIQIFRRDDQISSP